MKIQQMHTWFRQYAQQMGMQNVRAILPEQIDTFINTAIDDTIQEVISNNVGTTNDRVITDNAKLASVNALRTLYKVKEVDLKGKAVSDYGLTPLTFHTEDLEIAPLYYVDFAIRYGSREAPEVKPGGGFVEGPVVADENFTRWFPIRIIDDQYLADVLNDYVLAPRMRTPVMVIYGLDPDNDDLVSSTFELYFGENDLHNLEAIASAKYVRHIRVSYIKKPNRVRYVSDLSGNPEEDIHCDLPEQLHIPMLKHAVDLYRTAMIGSMMAAQGAAQGQQREATRNNYRPVNEGYQS